MLSSMFCANHDDFSIIFNIFTLCSQYSERTNLHLLMFSIKFHHTIEFLYAKKSQLKEIEALNSE